MNIFEINRSLMGELEDSQERVAFLESRIADLESDNDELQAVIDIVWGELKRKYPLTANELWNSSKLLKEWVA